MKSLGGMTIGAVIVAAYIGASGQVPSTDPGVERVIEQLEREWEQALIKNDQATIDRIVARDCVFVSSTGELMTKAQADSDRRGSALQASTITQLNIRVFGDTAIAVGANLETSQYDGQDTSGQYRWTDVFAKRNGRWQVVSAHSTRVDTPMLAERPTIAPMPPGTPGSQPNTSRQSIEGLTEDQVRARMGPPNISSTAADGVTTWLYSTPNGPIRVYFYEGRASATRQR